MNKETTTITVRTSPEIRQEVEEIITEIMDDNNLSTKGEAFSVLANAFRELKGQQTSPDYKEELINIKNLLRSAYNNVLAITDLSSASVLEQKLTYENNLAQLKKQIEKLKEDNQRLVNENSRQEHEIMELEAQLGKAKEELKDKQQLETIIQQLKRLEERKLI